MNDSDQHFSSLMKDIGLKGSALIWALPSEDSC